MQKNKKLKTGTEKSKFLKNIVVIIFIFLTISLLFTFVTKQEQKIVEIPLSMVANKINAGEVEKIEVEQKKLIITTRIGTVYHSRQELNVALSESLVGLGANPEKLAEVIVTIKEIPDHSLFHFLLILFLPLIILGIFFFYIIKQAKGGMNQAFDFSKMQAKVFANKSQLKDPVTFDDVAGLKEVKEELVEIVDFLKNPKKYFKLGAKIPRGILLVGSPGTGKTLLAKALANEADIPFFSISGSEFIEMFVGVGSSRVRSLFNNAKKHKRAIIFIDELDAIGRRRGSGMGGGSDEREQTLNQILVEMDGFERESTVIVLAATNRPDVLDPALLRPGRFDRRVVLDLPDIEGREAILKIHSKNKPLAKNINLGEIAERTPGFSGADLANLFNEAALLTAKNNQKTISQLNLINSIEKVLLGPERKSHILSKNEKKISAYHEAGHAILTALLSKDPVRKISIISRGMVAGYVLKTPKDESKLKTKKDFMGEMAILLGGYIAEKLKFKEITTGASNDLKVASSLARSLVKEYGMSALGPISFSNGKSLSFLSGEISEVKNYSEQTAIEIDREMKNIIQEAEKMATEVLTKNIKVLEKIATRLIEKETIEKEEFEELMK
jgi:cell division protease FtsH